MVKDVQKLKEELNEMELSLGTFMTDLPSCIGEVEQAREREIMDERRESVEVGMPLRPRLTASIYSYSAIETLEESLGADQPPPTEEVVVEEEDEEVDGGATLSDDATPMNSPHSTPTKVQQAQKQSRNNGTLYASNFSSPSSTTAAAAGGAGADASKPAAKQTSLAQFTDALYSSELEGGSMLRPKVLAEMASVPPGLSMVGGASRSPVTKTRLRVVKSEMSDPVVAAWQQSSTSKSIIRLRESQPDRNLEVVTMPTDSQLTDL